MKNAYKSLPFHIMAKPVSYRCNLKCDYCFYLEKEAYYPDKFAQMDKGMLKRYIRDYIEASPGQQVDFAWQGGEPTLAGLDFYKRVVALQQAFAGKKTITNSFQTNGIAINKQWAQFFAEHDFLVGISVDGGADIHDKYRISTNGKATFERVCQVIGLLKDYQVQFNTLTVINDQNWNKGKETYALLKSIGSENMQFIPIVELEGNDSQTGKSRFSPPRDSQTTPYSVPSHGYGKFITDVFNEWKKDDIGIVFVQTFEMLLAQKLGYPAGLCVFNEECGRNVIIEANGDVYSCDHFVYPVYKLGNIQQSRLTDIVNSKKQRRFGENKRTQLTQKCQSCQFLPLCHGGCPKQRVLSQEGEKHKHNYLCESYEQIFRETSEFFASAASQVRQHYGSL